MSWRHEYRRGWINTDQKFSNRFARRQKHAPTLGMLSSGAAWYHIWYGEKNIVVCSCWGGRRHYGFTITQTRFNTVSRKMNCLTAPAHMQTAYCADEKLARRFFDIEEPDLSLNNFEKFQWWVNGKHVEEIDNEKELSLDALAKQIGIQSQHNLELAKIGHELGLIDAKMVAVLEILPAKNYFSE